MKRFLLCCAAVALLFTTNVFADEAEEKIALIKQIQMLTRDASWTPGITSMARLSEKEASKLCGLFIVFPEKQIPADIRTDLVVRGSAHLGDKVTGIKNQAQCGSCWAFAAVACIEIANAGKRGQNSLDLSEQHLVSCCTSSSGCNGGYIDSTFDWVQNNGGVVSEEAYPYTSGSGDTGECQSVDGQQTNFSDYSACYILSQVKAALDAGHPVDTGMKVYDDFRYYKSGVYKHVTGSYLGGHAVCIVGYNDSESCLIVKNSWSENWGENGYFRIKYNDCQIPWMAVAVK